MRLVLLLIGGMTFIIAAITHIIVRLTLKPKEDSDLFDTYYEFEEDHPDYIKYSKWTRITYTAAIIAMLMLFAAIAV